MSEQAVVVHESAPAMTRDQIELLKRTVCKGSTDDEFKLFIQVCQRTRLDPFARQVFAVKRWDRETQREIMSIQVSIDGFRLQAERTGKYAGQRGPFWTADGKEWLEVWLDPNPPRAAKVAILRSDFQEPLWAVAKWDEYAQKKKDGSLTAMWHKMGALMLAKCAEALGLRKAFPKELSGQYTSDEIAQAATVHEDDRAPAVDTSTGEVIPGTAKGRHDALATGAHVVMGEEGKEWLRARFHDPDYDIKKYSDITPEIYRRLSEELSQFQASPPQDEDIPFGEQEQSAIQKELRSVAT